MKKLLIFLPVLAMLAGGCSNEKEHVHSLQRHNAVDSTCIKQGTIEYWSCECGAKFSDENGKTAITSIDAPLANHKAKKVNAVAPTCVKDGNIQYWTCEVCNKKFSDEACSKELTNVLDPKKGHSLEHHDAVPGADCQTKGTIEYWSCKNCTDKFADAEGKTTIMSIEGLLGKHTLSHHDAVPGADCKTNGTIEYWDCSVCSKMFSDDKGETEITSIVGPVGKHILSHHDAVPGADCQTNGTIEYWDCSVCSKMFSDDKGETEITSIVGPVGKHTLSHHDAKDTTCTANGNIEHWTCDVCSKYFLDKDGENETTEEGVVVVTEGHKWKETYSKNATDHWVDCKNCTETKEKAAHTFEGHEFVVDGNKVMKHCSVCGDVEVDTATPISLGIGYTDAAGFHYNILNGANNPFDVDEVFTPLNPEVINTNLATYTFKNRNDKDKRIVSIFATLENGSFMTFGGEILVKKSNVYYALSFVGQAYGSGQSRLVKETFDASNIALSFMDSGNRVLCFNSIYLGYTPNKTTTLSWTTSNKTYWKIQKISDGVTTDIGISPSSNSGMPAGPVKDVSNDTDGYTKFSFEDSSFENGEKIVIKAGSAFVYRDLSGYLLVDKDIIIEKTNGQLVCVKSVTEFDNEVTAIEHWGNVGQVRISNFDLIPNYSEDTSYSVDAYFGVKYQKACEEPKPCNDLEADYWNKDTTLTGFWIKKVNGESYSEGDKLIFEDGALFHCTKQAVGEFGKIKNGFELLYTSGVWTLVTE